MRMFFYFFLSWNLDMVSSFTLQSFDSSEPKLFSYMFSSHFHFSFRLWHFSVMELIMEYNTCVTFVVSRHEFLHLVVWRGMEGALN